MSDGFCIDGSRLPLSTIQIMPTRKNYKLIVDNISSIEDVRSLLKALDMQFILTDEQSEPIKHLIEEVV